MATRTQSSHFVIILSIFAALGGLLFGYDTGIISGALLFIKKDFALATNAEEFVVSSLLLAAAVSALITGVLTDLIGRRFLIIVSSFLFCVGALILGLADGYNWLIVGRLFVGFAVGMSSTAVPLYISESAPANHRGMLVTLNQLFITIGILLAYCVNLGFANVFEGWRWMFALAIIPGLIQCIGMIFLPDSPRFLLSKGREKEALAVLNKTRIRSHVEADLKRIKKNLRQQSGAWSELFQKKVVPALTITIILQAFQQITGINTVIYYAPEIFQQAGFKSTTAAILATMGVGAVNVIMTFVSLPLLDRWGRRPLLMTSVGGMAVSLFVIMSAFFLPQLEFAPYMAMVAVMGFVGFFAIGLGSIPWLLPSEILPTKIRGRAASLSVLMNWAANFLVASVFLSLIRTVGGGLTFAIFGFITLIALGFTYAAIPETKNKTLEDLKIGWFYKG